jgi:hypothetical protein
MGSFMKHMNRNSLSALAVFALASSPVVAGQKAEKIAITAAAPKAALIIKAEDIPISYPYQTGFRLGLQIYDPDLQTMKGGPFGGSATFEGKTKLFYGGYLVMDVKPGTYVFRDLSRQDRWALCFHNSSLQFTVQPGEVIFLGEFNSGQHVRELEEMAIMTGRVVSTNSEAVHFFDGITAPMLSPVDDLSLNAVGEMMKKYMPNTTVAAKPANFSPARFGTGSDLFGLNRVCGGYFTKKAKPAVAPPKENSSPQTN